MKGHPRLRAAILGSFGLSVGPLAYLIINGFRVSTLNSNSFSQVVFDFAVTGDMIVQGIVAALVIGLIGGIMPAVRAARLPVAQALRELQGKPRRF
jgi:putative ABC transport system permease protein